MAKIQKDQRDTWFRTWTSNQRRLVSCFAQQAGLRRDWHEPDEQEVSAKVFGTHLDNAFGEEVDSGEFVIELSNPDIRININLACLLADYAELVREREAFQAILNGE